MLAHTYGRRNISKVDILTNPPLLVDDWNTLSISSSLSNRFKIQTSGKIKIQTRGMTEPPRKTKEDERSRAQGKHLNSRFEDLKRGIPYPDFSRSTTGTPSRTNMYFSHLQSSIYYFFPTIQNSNVQDEQHQHKGTNKG